MKRKNVEENGKIYKIFDLNRSDIEKLEAGHPIYLSRGIIITAKDYMSQMDEVEREFDDLSNELNDEYEENTF